MSELIVLYDNNADGDLWRGWGFSVLARTDAATLLLDTGADKLVLEHNAKKLGVRLESVAILVISHDHCDHMGAISSVLRRGQRLAVPKAAAKRFRRVRQSSSGIDVLFVKAPVDLCPGVRSIGQMGRAIPEQALLLEGSQGPVLLTGCAHMGVTQLIQRATELAGEPIDLLLGGFHLFNAESVAIDRVVSETARLGVRRVAAGHCTGEKAIAAFRSAFGEKFIEIRVGTRIEV